MIGRVAPSYVTDDIITTDIIQPPYHGGDDIITPPPYYGGGGGSLLDIPDHNPISNDYVDQVYVPPANGGGSGGSDTGGGSSYVPPVKPKKPVLQQLQIDSPAHQLDDVTVTSYLKKDNTALIIGAVVLGYFLLND